MKHCGDADIYNIKLLIGKHFLKNGILIEIVSTISLVHGDIYGILLCELLHTRIANGNELHIISILLQCVRSRFMKTGYAAGVSVHGGVAAPGEVTSLLDMTGLTDRTLRGAES